MTNVSGVEKVWGVKGKSKPTVFDLPSSTASSSSQPRSVLVNDRENQTRSSTVSLPQSEKGSTHKDGFDLPHVSCCPFTGPERKAKASLVFAWLTQRDQEFFPLYEIFNKI